MKSSSEGGGRERGGEALDSSVIKAGRRWWRAGPPRRPLICGPVPDGRRCIGSGGGLEL